MTLADETNDPLYLTTAEVAARFRTAPGTVRQWRHSGTGPRGTKFGRRVLYALADVEAWERSTTAAEHGRTLTPVRALTARTPRP